ncbi:ABC-F family ATP-binding cassette domain-containing protein [Nocardioides korecus]
MANLVNLEKVSKSYGVRILLDEVSLGVGEGDRIGIVGRNGDGKTTLLNLIAGRESADTGRVSTIRGLRIGYLDQRDLLDDTHTVREVVLAGRADHEWAGDSRAREVVEVLLAGISLDREVSGLSGGERRRCSLARLLLTDDDLLILDEPTNHLDVEAVAWLAAYLVERQRRARGSALVVVTHDRWFLDAVCDRTWEVHPAANGAGVVDAYDGGYAAFVLARAERQRQASSSEQRRQNLARKELAWLRRGAPARTSKPKFRIDAANALIEDVPPPRDRLELQKFATQRLGKDVVDLEHVDLTRGTRQLLSDATWRLGPGDRVGVVGVNGAGKSSVLNLVAGALEPDAGKVKRGRTVALQHLTQQVPPEDPDARVLPAIEDIRRVTRTATGQEVSASSMLERFGFTGDKLTTRIGDLSGGERRRFQLLKLLLSEPNVLLLDEPTNDLDIDTLNVVEDFLDSWPGTLIVVSHDRYFLERVTDATWALTGDGQISMLPGGVDQYLEIRSAQATQAAQAAQAERGGSSGGRGGSSGGRGGSSGERGGSSGGRGGSSGGPAEAPKARVGGAQEREARKTVNRVEKQLAKITVDELRITDEMAAHGTDTGKLAGLAKQMHDLAEQRESLEMEWLEASELLE